MNDFVLSKMIQWNEMVIRYRLILLVYHERNLFHLREDDIMLNQINEAL